MTIKCEHPRLLFHPYLMWIVTTKECYLHRPDGEGPITHFFPTTGVYYNFPWHVFYQIKNLFEPDSGNPVRDFSEIDEYYFCDEHTHERICDLFILAPCGKCRLCRQERAEQWQTRCMCESAAWSTPPLFITLTYNNKNLPEDGVSKKDCQKFLKRLRRRIEYHLKVKTPLRYFLVAEYGKKTHRAHYHLLLWNMPYVNLAPGAENADYKPFQKLVMFLQFAWAKGHVRVEFCRDGSGRYCMKYMRKDCPVPDGCNETFFLASRGSEHKGIGYPWLSQHFDEYYNLLDAQSLSVRTTKKDKATGTVTFDVVNRAIPAYFKRKLWPTTCDMFPQAISNAVRGFVFTAVKAFHVFNYRGDDENLAELFDRFRFVKQQYEGVFRLNFDDAVCNHKWFQSFKDLEYVIQNSEYGDYDEDFRSDEYSDGDEFLDMSIKLASDFFTYYDSWKLLSAYSYDKEAVMKVLAHSDEHKKIIRQLNEKLPDLDIEGLIHKYEVDQRWERTHWTEDAI